MIKYKFIPSKIKHWKQTEYKENKFWSAGLSSSKLNTYKELIIKSINNKNKLLDILNSIDQNFALIIINKEYAFIAVDHARTYPIYFSAYEDYYYFSPQADEINKILHCRVDNEQRLAFQMSGYTISNNTLWKDIKSLDPGSSCSFIKNKKPILINYFNYRPWENYLAKNTNFKKKLKIQINTIFKKLIDEAKGRTIMIPLSAGLDSRLIASGLKHFGYKNVKCFSYGKKDNFEALSAKKIAKKLGYTWKFCEINRININKFYKTETFKNFIKNTNDGVATVGIQDVYAIYYLRKINFIKKSDIIVNGNSGDFISGGHIPIEYNNNPYLLIKKNNNNYKSIIKSIINIHIKKHYFLWGELHNKKNKKIICNLLVNQINELNIHNTKNINSHGLLEYLEFNNRQSKYVINLQRTYDFYNQKWKLPLWDKDFMHFWTQVPLNLKLGQKLYKEVLKELNFSGVWTKEYDLQYKIPSLRVTLIRGFLKALHIFSSKENWHKFERRYILYWTDNLYGLNIRSYKEIISNKNDARNAVSWLSLNSEKITLGNNWQEKLSKKEKKHD
jgi:asparagine synthase (glutamine-hydrolysing)